MAKAKKKAAKKKAAKKKAAKKKAAKKKNTQWSDIARAVLSYFENYRGIGHTRAVAEGVGNVKGKLIVAERQIKRIKGVQSRDVISLAELAQEGFASTRIRGFPMALDNSAVIVLLKGLLAEIDDLNKE